MILYTLPGFFKKIFEQPEKISNAARQLDCSIKNYIDECKIFGGKHQWIEDYQNGKMTLEEFVAYVPKFLSSNFASSEQDLNQIMQEDRYKDLLNIRLKLE